MEPVAPPKPEPVKTSQVKKPLTAFFIFSTEVRKIVSDEHPGIKTTEVQKIIGDRWKNMSDLEKGVYNEKARVQMEKYKQDLQQEAAENGGKPLAPRPIKKKGEKGMPVF